MQPADRGAVLGVLRSTGQFRDQEIDVALEVFDAAFGTGDASLDTDYTFLGAYDAAGVLVGYVTFGPTPQTKGTWDLYWIAVAKEAHGRGIGSELLAAVEAKITKLGARLLLIETSSRTDYENTRGFYIARGYREEARIREFYAPNDDRVMLTKSL